MLSKILQNKSLFKALFIGWFIISFILFVMPSDRLHNNTNLTDKQAHFLVFAVGMCCLSYAQKSQKLVKNAILLVLYGVAVEFIQASLPISFHRGAQVLDAVADAIGVLIGYLLVLFLNKKINF